MQLSHFPNPSNSALLPFDNFKAPPYPLPLGKSCPSLDHTDIQMLFRAIRPPRSALNFHFHSLRHYHPPPHTLFFYFSLFHYCCFVWRTAHKSVNRSLVAAYGAITCWVERECQNIQGDIFSQHSYSIWWISLHGRLSLQPCGEHLDSLEGGWDNGQGYVILFTRNHF